jgi:inner membrane transporter RhtA
VRSREVCLLVRRPRPELYFVGSAVFHYLGPAFAVLLFARIEPLGVAWLRIAAAGAVFAVWRKPWRALRGVDAETKRLVIGLGLVFAVMNSCFYVAIDRLPLGTVAAIEFLPVIVLAALGTRTWRNALALALAVPGVYVLTDVRLDGEPVGVAFAFANAGLFALYIVLAHRVSRGTVLSRLDGLAAAMARLSRATYSLMVSLLPATATVIGVVVLAQIPSTLEAFGVALVVAAVAVHREEAPAAEVRLPQAPQPSATRPRGSAHASSAGRSR